MSSSSSLPPQKAFDNLADLFLTEPLDADELAAIEFGDEPADDSYASSSSHATTTGDVEDDREQTGPNANHGNPSLSLNLVGAEVEDDGDKSEAPARNLSRRSIEHNEVSNALQDISLLITGHLPVQGRLWINQIASMIARQGGPTVLLRDMGAGEISADLFTSHADSAMHHAIRDAIADDRAERRGRIETIIAVLKQSISRWMIHLDSPDERAIRDRVAGARGAIRMTIATGVDPAAMVGVYRTLKTLLPVLNETITIGLVFVGSDEEKSKAAFDRLENAVGGFLDRRIEYLGSIRRMEPIEFSNLGEFAWFDLDDAKEADGLLDLIPTIVGGRRAVESDADEPMRPELKVHVRPVGAASHRSSHAERRHRPAARASSTSEVKPTVAAGSEIRLVDFVPGLTDLVARSPKAPAIELACDNDGRIHLLARDDHASSANANNSIEHLLNVCDWIEAHASILALLRTMPGHLSEQIQKNRGGIETIAHLFTATPQRYANMMDGRLRIHLLATEADLRRHSDAGWCHLPIN